MVDGLERGGGVDLAADVLEEDVEGNDGGGEDGVAWCVGGVVVRCIVELCVSICHGIGREVLRGGKKE